MREREKDSIREGVQNTVNVNTMETKRKRG